jgi:hypothetical protein
MSRIFSHDRERVYAVSNFAVTTTRRNERGRKCRDSKATTEKHTIQQISGKVGDACDLEGGG